MLLKKTVYDNLVAKVNCIGTSGIVLKTRYDTDKSEIENKIRYTSVLVKNTDYNVKITGTESKIPSITGLATTSVLTAVKNKIPNINSLVKKTDNDTKITEIEKKLTDYDHEKYVTTPELNTLGADVFNARLKQVDLLTNTDFDDKLRTLNQKINSDKTNHLLVENKFEKLKTFSSIYFRGKCHFEEDGTQNYLVFQSKERFFKWIVGVCNGSYIYYYQSKGLSEEKITSIKTPNHSISPAMNYYVTRTKEEFYGRCLKQDKIMYTHGEIVNIYTVYEIVSSYNDDNYPTL